MKDAIPSCIVLVALIVYGCTRPPAKDVLEETAGGTYAAEHMWCVERFDTTAEINACRAAVRRRWGIVETARKDGGQ